MAHSYRTLQNWNLWLEQQFLGKALLSEEKEILSRLLKKHYHYGKHAIMIGVPNQISLFSEIDIPNLSLIRPHVTTLKEKNEVHIESDLHELPILSGCADLVLIPHTLEFVENPRHLFSEACRIVKPEGLIVVIGFNPRSIWGLKNPMASHLIHAKKIRDWLKLEAFAIEDEQSILFRPPVNSPNLFNHLQVMEKLGRVCFPPFGGAYIVIARAKVIPLTPIKMKWTQQLNHIHIPSTITGNIARRTK